MFAGDVEHRSHVRGELGWEGGVGGYRVEHVGDAQGGRGAERVAVAKCVESGTAEDAGFVGHAGGFEVGIGEALPEKGAHSLGKGAGVGAELIDRRRLQHLGDRTSGDMEMVIEQSQDEHRGARCESLERIDVH